MDPSIIARAQRHLADTRIFAKREGLETSSYQGYYHSLKQCQNISHSPFARDEMFICVPRGESDAQSILGG